MMTGVQSPLRDETPEQRERRRALHQQKRKLAALRASSGRAFYPEREAFLNLISAESAENEGSENAEIGVDSTKTETGGDGATKMADLAVGKVDDFKTNAKLLGSFFMGITVAFLAGYFFGSDVGKSIIEVVSAFMNQVIN